MKSAILFYSGRIEFLSYSHNSGRPSTPSMFLAFGERNVQAIQRLKGTAVQVIQAKRLKGGR